MTRENMSEKVFINNPSRSPTRSWVSVAFVRGLRAKRCATYVLWDTNARGPMNGAVTYPPDCRRTLILIVSFIYHSLIRVRDSFFGWIRFVFTHPLLFYFYFSLLLVCFWGYNFYGENNTHLSSIFVLFGNIVSSHSCMHGASAMNVGRA